jgi:hypothetical protein
MLTKRASKVIRTSTNDSKMSNKSGVNIKSKMGSIAGIKNVAMGLKKVSVSPTKKDPITPKAQKGILSNKASPIR